MPLFKRMPIDTMLEVQKMRDDGCVNLSDIPLSLQDMEKIFAELNNDAKVKSIILQNCLLRDSSVKPLIKLVQTNKNIVDVDYSKNKIGFENECAIVEAVAKNKKEMPPNIQGRRH